MWSGISLTESVDRGEGKAKAASFHARLVLVGTGWLLVLQNTG